MILETILQIVIGLIIYGVFFILAAMEGDEEKTELYRGLLGAALAISLILLLLARITVTPLVPVLALGAWLLATYLGYRVSKES